MADNREDYWRAFEEYLDETNACIALHDHYGQPQFRKIWIAGVPKTGSNLFVRWPHFAVAVTKQASKHGPAGARVQLVLPKRDFYERIEDEHRSAIDQKIADRHWIPPIGPNGETGSLTVTTSHHLDDPAARCANAIRTGAHAPYRMLGWASPEDARDPLPRA